MDEDPGPTTSIQTWAWTSDEEQEAEDYSKKERYRCQDNSPREG